MGRPKDLQGSELRPLHDRRRSPPSCARISSPEHGAIFKLGIRSRNHILSFWTITHGAKTPALCANKNQVFTFTFSPQEAAHSFFFVFFFAWRNRRTIFQNKTCAQPQTVRQRKSHLGPNSHKLNLHSNIILTHFFFSRMCKLKIPSVKSQLPLSLVCVQIFVLSC